MTMTRRRLVGSAAAFAAVTAIASQQIANADEPETPNLIEPTPQAAGAITPELIALNRMGYGPRPAQSVLVQNPAGFPGDVARIAALGGLDAYIEQQLDPASIDDSFCDQQLAATRFRFNYAADNQAPPRYPAVNELRPLDTLVQTVTQLWPLADFGTAMDWSERQRPWYEVRITTAVRAIYSERQLQEILVDFWHNHFNVNASGDVTQSVAFPDYDRIMRQNCLGNFRTFVEAVAKSTAMLYYLDNYSNRASGGEGGNENYARELFELHTLGSDNYLKFYDDRSQIGTVTYNGETFARGYIDQDVYEAAECLTGWTVGNGDWRLPAGTLNNGAFVYVHAWHSGGTKLVLSQLISNGQATADYMKDGQAVFKLLTDHVGTARFLCTKLCRRLISDYPPSDVIEAAVAEWMANRTAPDQIKRVVRVILKSAAFKNIWGQKVKRPFDFFVSYVRATNAQVRLVDDAHPSGSCWGSLFSTLSNTGHRLYEWATPTGHPDLASYWLSTNGMLRRWNIPYSLISTGQYGINIQVNLFAQTPTGLTSTQIVDYWIDRLFGYAISSSTRTALISFMAQTGSPNSPPPLYSGETTLQERIECLVYLMSMAPEFQQR